MKNKIMLSLYALTILMILVAMTSAQSMGIKVEEAPINDVITMEDTNIPATFNVTISNSGSEDFFHVFTLLEARLEPIINYRISQGGKETLVVTIDPYKELKQRCGRGLCSLEYFVRGESTNAIPRTLLIEILPLEEIIKLDVPSVIAHDASILVFNISNPKNIDFGDVIFTFDSEFSKVTENLTIPAKSSQKMELLLDADTLKAAEAGEYPVKLNFLINDYNYVVEQNIQLQEYLNVVTEEHLRIGFLGMTKFITRRNEGNTPQLVTIEVRKSRFEKSFTSANINPTYEKYGIMGWQQELKPGESLAVEIRTDYTIPVIFLIIIIAVALYFYFTKRPGVLVKKKAFRVKTSGGEFALKIVIHVKNHGREARGVVCRDRLPPLANIYEKRWGATKPDEIERNTLAWKFGDLASREERAVSYIIYSRIVPVGTFGIPTAAVTYTDHKNQRRTVVSNTLLLLLDKEKKKE